MQVGNVSIDHPIDYGKEYVAEALVGQKVPRTVYTLSTLTNGSDLAGEAVAAYASLSMLFAKSDPELSVALEDDAYAMYGMMEKMPNTKYSDANPQFENVRLLPALIARPSAVCCLLASCGGCQPAVPCLFHGTSCSRLARQL